MQEVCLESFTVPVMASARAPVTQTVPVAATTDLLHRRGCRHGLACAVHIANSGYNGRFFSLTWDFGLCSREVQGRTRQAQPLAASVAGEESVSVSGTRTRPLRILVLSLRFGTT